MRLSARLLTLVLLAAPPLGASAQRADAPFDVRTTNVIVPQRGGLVLRPGAQRLHVSAVEADVAITGQVALTTLEVAIANPSARPEEAVMLVPIPDGAVIRAFGFDGVGPEPTARILPADEARNTYETIVRSMRDPALLEFAGLNLVRSSAFPLAPGATQKVTLIYEHVLAADGDRIDYHLPRSEAFDAAGIPWTIRLRIESARPIATAYSPSHDMQVETSGARSVTLHVGPEALRQPGAFRLSYLQGGEGVPASFMLHPDDDGVGGTFLLLGGLPRALVGDGTPRVRREVTLVLDRSGSMRGEKLDQAREAALQVIEGLEFGELFNVVDYSDSVARFEAQPVVKTAESLAAVRVYLANLRAMGGTNIGDALRVALAQPAPAQLGLEGTLPVVLFLTDGLPTIGEITESGIRAIAEKANAARRRIFTFGVGFDVNAPLLDHLAEVTRGTNTYVHPDEDVEVKVAQVFRRLHGPLLSEPSLRVLDLSGRESVRAVRDLLPGRLPDLFEGDQLVVLGRYETNEPLRFELAGTRLGDRHAASFLFDPKLASRVHSFVPRLWADRRIAVLADEIRQRGHRTQAEILSDPRLKELVDEIVTLSTRYGILTEYTAFLATEADQVAAEGRFRPGSDAFFLGRGEAGAPTDALGEPVLESLGYLGAPEAARRRAEEVALTAADERGGRWAVAQAENLKASKERKTLNRANVFLDAEGNVARTDNVQQVKDKTFFRRGKQWVDAELFAKREAAVGDAPAPEPELRIVAFGTAEYFERVARLAAEGRQAAIALGGDVLLLMDGEQVLFQAP